MDQDKNQAQRALKKNVPESDDGRPFSDIPYHHFLPNSKLLNLHNIDLNIYVM